MSVWCHITICWETLWCIKFLHCTQFVYYFLFSCIDINSMPTYDDRLFLLQCMSKHIVWTFVILMGDKDNDNNDDYTILFKVSSAILGETPVALRQMIMKIYANDRACEWKQFFCWNIWDLYGSTSQYNYNDGIWRFWLFANQYESNKTRYNAVRCSMMQHMSNMMHYEAVHWWWRITCDEK